MGRMKDFGLEIAQKLFEENRVPGDIARDYPDITDREWLMQQILHVRDNPKVWGYDQDVFWFRKLLNWIRWHPYEWLFPNKLIKWLTRSNEKKTG